MPLPLPQLYSRALRLGPNRRAEWKEVFKRDCVSVLSILVCVGGGAGGCVVCEGEGLRVLCWGWGTLEHKAQTLMCVYTWVWVEVMTDVCLLFCVLDDVSGWVWL